jgi:hypothetical protein
VSVQTKRGSIRGSTKEIYTYLVAVNLSGVVGVGIAEVGIDGASIVEVGIVAIGVGGRIDDENLAIGVGIIGVCSAMIIVGVRGSLSSTTRRSSGGGLSFRPQRTFMMEDGVANLRGRRVADVVLR